MNNNISKTDLIKKFFTAFQNKDKETVENMLSEDLTFISPDNDTFSKKDYMDKCFPFSEDGPLFKFEKIFEKENELFILYEISLKNGNKFRNTEFIRFEGDLIKDIEVYFGNTIRQ
ncbi:nuclear transport factor 2 family protein [soil metagenome]